MSVPLESSCSISHGTNGNKQKNRLENILFKLKKPDPDLSSKLTPSSPPSPEPSSSIGNSDASNGKDSTIVPNLLKLGTDCTNINRRSSRKPSKRKKELLRLVDHDNKCETKVTCSQKANVSSSQKADLGQNETKARHIESDKLTGKEALDKEIENVQIKLEKEDAQDWPEADKSIDLESDSPSQQRTDPNFRTARTFSCTQCGETFETLHELDMHKDSHIKQESRSFSVHPCYICGKSFASEAYLSRHIVVHDVEGLESDQEDKRYLVEAEDEMDLQKEYYKCDRCRRVFTTDDALQLHKCRKGLVKPYGCGFCGRCYTHFSNLTNHLSLHKDGLAPDLECYECGQKFMYSIELRRHVNIHIKANYTPASVSRTAAKLSSTATTTNLVPAKSPGIDDDMNSASAKDSFKPLKLTLPLSRFAPAKKTKKRGPPKANPCKVCGKIFYQRSYLTMHMKVHNEKKYECSHCGSKFAFKKSLEIHVRSHTGEKPYHCDICGKDFARQDSLHKHQKMHMGVKPFVCETCGRQFGDKFELQRHSLSHSQEKPHKCNACSKAYNDKKRLKEHMFIHSGELPFSCSLCGKGFARKYRYNQHMDQHAGESRYQCETCSKGFYRRSDLNSHREIHSGKKPFRCDSCDMEFLRESYLRRHMIVHSADKPYSCSFCGKNFSRKNTLRRHLLIHKKKGDDEEDDYTEINERYNNFNTDFGYGISGSVTPLPVSNAEERDIMRDIQAVIGLGDVDKILVEHNDELGMFKQV